MPRQLRVYPMDDMGLTPEQIAVTFARTSRSPDPFDAIARQVTTEAAACFHEQWVIDYGHASVAEHAVVHMAVENVSRLAGDALETSRLASYTEKSSRYQVIAAGSYHVPREVERAREPLGQRYEQRIQSIFAKYAAMVAQAVQALGKTHPPHEDETGPAWQLRKRRLATDAVRNVLPSATLTNIGMTANARTLEHAVSKLLSSGLQEPRTLGAMLREHGRQVIPTLVKYAGHNPYLAHSRAVDEPGRPEPAGQPEVGATLIRHDPDAVVNLAAALLFRRQQTGYRQALATARGNAPAENAAVIRQALEGISRHDPLPREFETVNYLLEFVMDYGALREFRRHRMMTPISQPLTISNGYETPALIALTSIAGQYSAAIAEAETLYQELAEISPDVAQYAVTHAHRQRVLVNLNLRQLRHLVQLRTADNAHPSISQPVRSAIALIRNVHPELAQVL